MNTRLIYITLLLLSFLISCTKGVDTPEGLLRMYVSDITSTQVDKDYYLKYTTGKMRASVENMSEEDIKSLNSTSNLSNVKVDILQKSCQENKCSLTYIISYKSTTSDNVGFNTEVKKIAQLVKEGEDWKIESVLNSKTYHEAQQAIDLSGEK